MTTTTFPSNLVFLRPADEAEAKAAPRRSRSRLVSRRELLQRLDTIGDLAERAPLSFLAVRLRGVLSEELDDALVAAIGEHILRIIRPIDSAGLLAPGVYGVVLQGSGLAAASAVASRLAHHLNQLAALRMTGLVAEVYAATGTGKSARALPAAAMEHEAAG